jgi:hypothetical protein
MDEEIWRLPGPAGLIAAAVRELSRGRHTAVVVPAVLADSEAFVAGLISSLTAELWTAGELPSRVVPDEEEDGPLQWLGQAFEIDDPLPGTAHLLDHPAAAERIALFDCCPLNAKHRREVSATLTRIVAESRPRPVHQRPRLLLVCTQDALPRLGTDSADVTFEALWWWGRLSRWDIAARIVPAIDAASEPGVLRDVLLETVIEVCRWDVWLATKLATEWDGDPDSLPELIAEAGHPSTGSCPAELPRSSGRRPHGDVAGYWDKGSVDLWHDETTPSIRAMTGTEREIRHAVWAAQARVLLPWIETRRQLVAADLLRTHGKAATYAAAGVDDASADILEVGPLCAAVRSLVGRQRPALRDAVHQLRNARNQLAHLQALTIHEQRDLVRAFAGINLRSAMVKQPAG